MKLLTYVTSTDLHLSLFYLCLTYHGSGVMVPMSKSVKCWFQIPCISPKVLEVVAHALPKKILRAKNVGHHFQTMLHPCS